MPDVHLQHLERWGQPVPAGGSCKRWIPSACCFSLPFPHLLSLWGFGAAQPSDQSRAGNARSRDMGFVPTRRRGKSRGERGCWLCCSRLNALRSQLTPAQKQRETAGTQDSRALDDAVFPQTMTGQRFGKCIALCLLPWSCLSFAWSDAAGSRTTSPGAGHVRKGLPRDVANGTYVHSNISGTSASNRLPFPLRGCSGPHCAGTQGEGHGDTLMMA